MEWDIGHCVPWLMHTCLPVADVTGNLQRGLGTGGQPGVWVTQWDISQTGDLRCITGRSVSRADAVWAGGSRITVPPSLLPRPCALSACAHPRQGSFSAGMISEQEWAVCLLMLPTPLCRRESKLFLGFALKR